MTWVPSQFIDSWTLSVLSSIEKNSWDPGAWDLVWCGGDSEDLDWD